MPSAQRTKLLFLAAIGIVFSLILLGHDLSLALSPNAAPSFCSFSAKFDCDAVSRSDYARIFGVPISSLGLFYYTAFWFLVGLMPKDDPRSKGAACLFAALPVIPTVYLFAVSAFVLHTFCLMCGVLYLVNAALLIVAYSLGRSDGFLSELKAGGAAAVVFFRGGLDKDARALRERDLASISLILGFACAVLLPFAALQIMQSASKQRSADLVKAKLVENWQRTKQVDLPVNTSDDPAQRDLILGDPRAPITVVEFSDFECPFCRSTAFALKPILRDFAGSVRLVYKNYPLDGSCNPAISGTKHLFACRAALMARCAAEQGHKQFEAMYDALFTKSELTNEILEEMPKTLGLDHTRLSACVQSPQAKSRLAEDIALGNRLRLQGTPSLFVNGRQLLSAEPQVLRLVLESLTAGKAGSRQSGD